VLLLLLLWLLLPLLLWMQGQMPLWPHRTLQDGVVGLTQAAAVG